MKKSTKMKKYTKKTNRKRISKKQYRNKKSRIFKQKGGEGEYDHIINILYGYDASQNNYEAIKTQLSVAIENMTNEELIEMIPGVLPIFINDTIGETGNTIDDKTRKELFIECVKAKAESNGVLGEIEYELRKYEPSTLQRQAATKRKKNNRNQTARRPPTREQQEMLLKTALAELGGKKNEQNEFNNGVRNGQIFTSRNLRPNRTMNSTGHSRV